MRSEQELLSALQGQFARAKSTLRRANDYEELLLKESGRYLLAQMQYKEDRSGCAAVLDAYLEKQDGEYLAARLCQAVCLQATQQRIKLPLALHETARELQSICYVKSHFTEQAVNTLEKEISVFYAESFEDACEQVIDRRRDGCLLPYMGKDRLPLPGIARLIDEYGLKKCRMIEIENEEQSTVYLLLSSVLRPDPSADRMELMICADKQERLWQVLGLAGGMGISMNFPTSLRASSEIPGRDEPLFCRVTLQGEKKALLHIEEVMALCLPESEVTGLYTRKYIGG